MTLEMALAQAYFKEWEALTSLRRAIVSRPDVDPAWVYVVFALDARLHVLRDLLEKVDPQMLSTCEAQLAAERVADAQLVKLALQPSLRVH